MSKTVIACDDYALRHTLNLKDTAYIIYASLESYYKIMYIIVGRGGQIPRGVNGERRGASESNACPVSDGYTQ